jgi:hypothetical protein
VAPTALPAAGPMMRSGIVLDLIGFVVIPGVVTGASR